MLKFKFDKYYDKPAMWADVFKNLKEGGEEAVVETTYALTDALRQCADDTQIPVSYFDGTFLYDPVTKDNVCLKGPVLPALVQFFYQKAVQAKRQLTLVHMDGRVDNYYFGSQEEHDITDPNYPRTGAFADRSGIRFVVNARDIVYVVFKAEEKVIEAEWPNFDLMNRLQMGHVFRKPYEIIGDRE